jgi:hypothetical protein
MHIVLYAKKKDKMKKAKEHLEKFKSDEKSSGHEVATYNLVVALMDEVFELSKIRKSSTNATMISIIKEIDIKWRSICSKEKSLNKNGFSFLIKKDFGIEI